MEHPGFFERAPPLPLRMLADKLGAQLAKGGDADLEIRDVKPLAEAGPGELAFVDNRKYLVQLQQTRASACLVAPAFSGRVPARTCALVVEAPYRSFALALQHFYPDALAPKAALAAVPANRLCTQPRGWRTTSGSSPAPLSAARPRSGAAPWWRRVRWSATASR
jgi:UDP-3-O-[3-hydroxymyristoyl] glucosamine N-acyltransferase